MENQLTPNNSMILEIRELLENARKNVAQQVNTQLLTTYWNIGRIIVEYEQQNQIRADYGKQTLKELSKELTREFGKGFSRSNLQNMRAFYLAYEKCQTVSGKLSWSHYCELLSITDENKRSFYEKESVNSGWSVRELKRQMCIRDSARAAEEASYEEYKANLRHNAQNFRITDAHLGEGGPKAKFQANIEAIKLLKHLEETTGQATPEQQEILSRYVGWGGLADAFDPEKPAWAAEYAQLKELLTPEEYAAARSSTLNAHYTSPTVIPVSYTHLFFYPKLKGGQNTMPSKTEFYRQMADHVATQLTGSWQEWAGFLTTAARLYKYPFHEQLLIYAQRPDATACAEYDLWNEKMGRYVRRGSKGIALVDDSGDKPRLRYVFDITDTGTREHSRTPWLWKLEEQHRDSVSAMLERTYDVSGDDLAGQLTEVAGKLAEEYWTEHRQDFLYIVDDSFLEEYDEFNIEVQFKAAATISISYALMSRCGLEPERYFTHEDFMAIFDFNTPSTIGALGTAVSQINQQVLRQIGVTIRNAEREAIKERRPQHEESHELHPERRLSDSRPEAERTAGEAPGQVRQDAESIPQGTPSHPIQPATDEREAVPTPAGNRRDRTEPSGAADAPAGERRGRDGAAESQRPDALGGPCLLYTSRCV